MNKRIVELAEQAELSKAVYWMDQNSKRHFDHLYSLQDRHTDQVKKFAELIVQSIANIDFRSEMGLTSDQDYDIRYLIKNHFKDEQ
jgi:hypothetical protein